MSLTMPPKRPPVALSIAGTDPSGGAGIHADLKTFTAHKVYGTTVITALVAQNTHGVSRVYSIDNDFVADQFDSVLGDVHVDASKTGMLSTTSLVELVATRAQTGALGYLVVDPVMVATSGQRLLEARAVQAVRDLIVPQASLITPNLPEAALLLGDDEPEATSGAEMEIQARRLLDLGAAGVLLKGGHADSGQIIDVLALRSTTGQVEVCSFTHERIRTPHTHGTGCTLSAAITAAVARHIAEARTGNAETLTGQNLAGATELSTHTIQGTVAASLDYLARALQAGAKWELALNPTGSHGPVDHTVDLPEPRA